MFGMGASAIAREVVTLNANYAPGTIIINTGERRLYYVTSGGQAIRYGIGVGGSASPGRA
jgi:lipoprotein-anchoring transpeptidase ErfK/SrfK